MNLLSDLKLLADPNPMNHDFPLIMDRGQPSPTRNGFMPSDAVERLKKQAIKRRRMIEQKGIRSQKEDR